MNAQQLRNLMRFYVMDQGNPACKITAIYLGRSQFASLIEDPEANASVISPRIGGICFDGIPVYQVKDEDHARVTAERVA